MGFAQGVTDIEGLKRTYPEKFLPVERAFASIHAGDSIFIGTGCGEPQYLVRALLEYVRSHPKAFFDTEILQVWNLGVTAFTDDKMKDYFRYNSFFIGQNMRDAVNSGVADYTPIFLSAVPDLFKRKVVPVDVALLQMSPPDAHGFMSLGISVDIVRAAADNAGLRIAQMNANMPRVHGDTFLHIKEIDFIIPQDEPLIEFEARAPDDISQRIGKYVAEIIRDGDTIQVGYGSIPNSVLAHLKGKNHLGVHTELLSDGVADLMKIGVVDNSRKDIDRGKTVAAFCMGRKETYAFVNDNPGLELRPVSYTNDPLTIARNKNMTAINSALEIDLTGQATAESLGRYFFSGIGGQADFMRGAMLSRGGKTILAMQSTAEGGRVSRIVPLLREGAGVTLTRGDVHYVVTEHGIAYLHGKNIRERAMDLISIADPEFRPWLVDAARELGLIYKDQKFVPGEGGLYPETLETCRTTRGGLNILLRPVKITDEHRLKEFFYSLSSDCMYNRFISTRADMPHERLQRFVIVDYRKEMVILAALRRETGEMIVGLGQYFIDEDTHTAEVAFVVRDDYQNMGIGQELLSYLTQLAKKNGLHGFTAEILSGNEKMLHLFENSGFMTERRTDAGTCELKMYFREM